MYTDIDLFLSEKIERLEADLRDGKRVAKAKPNRVECSFYDDGDYGLMASAPATAGVVYWRHSEWCRPGCYYIFLDGDPLHTWRDATPAFHAVLDDFGNLVKVN